MMASRGAAIEKPADRPLSAGLAGGGSGGAASRNPAATPMAAFDTDNALTRVCPTPQLHRVALANGAGVCLHRIGSSFTVEVHAQDANGGLLLSMTQEQAAALAQRLMTIGQLVPGYPPGEGR